MNAVLLVRAASGADRAPQDLYQSMLKATASVVVRSETGTSTGTAWVIDRARRLLVTNHHVVGDRVQLILPVINSV